MASAATPALEAQLSKGPGRTGIIIFGIALLAGFIYTIISLAGDLGAVRTTSVFPFL